MNEICKFCVTLAELRLGGSLSNMVPPSLKKMRRPAGRKEGNYASSDSSSQDVHANRELGLTLLPGSQIPRARKGPVQHVGNNQGSRKESSTSRALAKDKKGRQASGHQALIFHAHHQHEEQNGNLRPLRQGSVSQAISTDANLTGSLDDIEDCGPDESDDGEREEIEDLLNDYCLPIPKTRPKFERRRVTGLVSRNHVVGGPKIRKGPCMPSSVQGSECTDGCENRNPEVSDLHLDQAPFVHCIQHVRPRRRHDKGRNSQHRGYRTRNRSEGSNNKRARHDNHVKGSSSSRHDREANTRTLGEWRVVTSDGASVEERLGSHISHVSRSLLVKPVEICHKKCTSSMCLSPRQCIPDCPFAQARNHTRAERSVSPASTNDYPYNLDHSFSSSLSSSSPSAHLLPQYTKEVNRSATLTSSKSSFPQHPFNSSLLHIQKESSIVLASHSQLGRGVSGNPSPILYNTTLDSTLDVPSLLSTRRSRVSPSSFTPQSTNISSRQRSLPRLQSFKPSSAMEHFTNTSSAHGANGQATPFSSQIPTMPADVAYGPVAADVRRLEVRVRALEAENAAQVAEIQAWKEKVGALTKILEERAPKRASARTILETQGQISLGEGVLAPHSVPLPTSRELIDLTVDEPPQRPSGLASSSSASLSRKSSSQEPDNVTKLHNTLKRKPLDWMGGNNPFREAKRPRPYKQPMDEATRRISLELSEPEQMASTAAADGNSRAIERDLNGDKRAKADLRNARSKVYREKKKAEKKAEREAEKAARAQQEREEQEQSEGTRLREFEREAKLQTEIERKAELAAAREKAEAEARAKEQVEEEARWQSPTQPAHEDDEVDDLEELFENDSLPDSTDESGLADEGGDADAEGETDMEPEMEPDGEPDGEPEAAPAAVEERWDDLPEINLELGEEDSMFAQLLMDTMGAADAARDTGP